MSSHKTYIFASMTYSLFNPIIALHHVPYFLNYFNAQTVFFTKGLCALQKNKT